MTPQTPTLAFTVDAPALLPGAGLYLMRHGETDLNAAGVLQGSIDAPLNARGLAQAREAVDGLAALGLARLVSSPQRRARQTADVIAAALALPVDEIADLRERDWGIYEGHLRAGRAENGTGVEPAAALGARALAALAAIAPEPGVPVLAVSHGGLIRALIAALGFAPPEAVANCAVIRLAGQ